MKRQPLILILSFIFWVFSASAQEITYSYKLLKDLRSELVLPPISLEQRLAVLDQAKFVYEELFIHKDLKLEAFGISSSPVPYLENLKVSAPTLSDTEFYLAYAKAYKSLRDWHSKTTLPKSYACHSTVLPFNFKEVQDESGKIVIAVHKFATSEYLNVLPGPIDVKPGDELISFDGKSAQDLKAQNLLNTSASNPDAHARTAVASMAYSSLSYSPIPDNNQVELVLKSADGIEYKRSVPWIIRRNETCLKKHESENTTAKTHFQEYNEIFSGPSSDDDGWIETGDPILKYKIIRNIHGTFGVIKLDSFYPNILSPDEITSSIKRILETDFRLTDGVIIDVRDNGGGYIRIGENIVQFFSPEKIAPLMFKLKVNAANLHYWTLAAASHHFTKALLLASSQNLPFIEQPLYLDGASSDQGQVYFKPVAVMNNALCYSTCDMFSALVQDFEAATVFGEDSTTGAGGANNWDFSSFYKYLPDDQKGPFAKPPLGMDIGFSYRQTLRVGKNKGQVIENVGVIPDQRLTPSVQDLRNVFSQEILQVSSYLKTQSLKYLSSVKVPQPIFNVTIHTRPVLKASWTKTTSIDFILNDKVIGTLETEEDNQEGHPIFYPAPFMADKLGVVKHEIVGRYLGKKVWRKVLAYDVIPETIALTPAAPFFLDFESTSEPLMLDGIPEDGWKLKGGALTIGENGIYDNDMDVRASLYLKLSTDSYQLTFTSTIETEADYDFFKLVIFDLETYETEVKTFSGSLGQRQNVIDLSKYQGRSIGIRFSFTSDGGINAGGASIDDVKIQSVPSLR